MAPSTRFALLSLAACSAPDPADAPGAPAPAAPVSVTPEPAPEAAPAPAGPPALAPVPGARAPAEPRPALPSDLPLPFTAWTTAAGLRFAPSDGGEPVQLPRAGLRVDVLSLGSLEVQVRCVACPGELRGREGTLPAGALRGVRTSGAADDVLAVMLASRAAWAGGRDLPAPGADREALCALVDHGFTSGPEEARFAWEDGEAVLRWTDGRWVLSSLTVPTGAPSSACAVKNPRAPGGPR